MAPWAAGEGVDAAPSYHLLVAQLLTEEGDYRGALESFETAMRSANQQGEPYVERIPVNPCNGLNTVRFDGEPAGTNEAGWRFDSESGLFQADDCPKHAVL